MFSVLLVDDEPWSLQSLYRIFDWHANGFEVIGKTTESKEAFSLICSEEPSVVFTDIRMPGLSGLELMKLTRERGIDTEFVIISGFADFTYAQEAIRQGAFDYRLKPVEADDGAEDLLTRLYKHISKKRKAKEAELFDILFNDSPDVGSILEQQGFDCSSGCFQAVIVRSDRHSRSGLSELIPHTLNKLVLEIGTHKYLILLQGQPDSGRLQGIGKFLDGLYHGVWAGISTLAYTANEIHRLYREADICACGEFLQALSNVVFFKDNNHGKEVQGITNSLISCIENGNFDDCKRRLEEIPNQVREQEFGMLQIADIWNRMVTYLMEYYWKTALSTGCEHLGYDQIVERFSDFRALCSFLTGVVDSIKSNQILNKQHPAPNSCFNKLVAFVDGNYNRKLSLKELSSMFFINFTYCCELFKKVKGKTFSEYITHLRMQKALSLLRHSDLDIAEISIEVGYEDYYYFNKVFKQIHGISPKKYRETC